MANLIMQEVHSLKLSINTTPNAQSDQAKLYAEVGAGIDNMQEQLNEVIQQYKFIADHGYSRSRVTGMAPIFTLSGRRIWNDVAQDYIFDQKYKLGGDRYTDAKLEYTADGFDYEIAFDCTIANLQELGGATEENSAITFEIHVNGKPTMTKKPTASA